MSFDGFLLNAMTPAIFNTFQQVSIISLFPAILNIISLVAVPAFTRMADVVGRAEALSVALGLYVVGYIVQATAMSLGHLAVSDYFFQKL
jgi:MFS family permease